MAGFFGNFQGTYDASNVIITIDDVIVHGFADGDFLSAKYDDDRYTKIKGIDGEVGRVRSVSKSGTIEFTLMASSGANDELNSFNPDFGYIGTFPMTVSDLSGRTVITTPKAWLKVPPPVEMGKEIGESKWIFDCAELDIVYGGAKNNSLFDMARSFF